MTTPGSVEALMTIPAGGAAISVTNNGGGPTVVTVPAGEYFLTAAGSIAGLIATLQTQLQTSRPPAAGSWSVTVSPTTGQVTITCPGTWSITWTNTTLRDELGFAGNIVAVSTPQTGTAQARGLWIPDSLFNIDGDPRMAPKVTDRRDFESPTGVSSSLFSSYKRCHNRPRWSHVTIDRVREGSAAIAKSSWEWFLDETQFGLGLSWFTPGSLIQIYDHSGNRVGSDANVNGWSMKGVASFEDTAKLALEDYTGLWAITIPRITAEGA